VKYGPEPFQYEPYEDVHCANCGMRGHRLRTCIGPLVNGFIRGCPRCNDVTHWYQNCPVKSNSIDIANFLIHGRMNQPPIQSTVDYKSLGALRGVLIRKESACGMRQQKEHKPLCTHFRRLSSNALDDAVIRVTSAHYVT
jgi:hypothetical protein